MEKSDISENHHFQTKYGHIYVPPPLKIVKQNSISLMEDCFLKKYFIEIKSDPLFEQWSYTMHIDRTIRTFELKLK